MEANTRRRIIKGAMLSGAVATALPARWTKPLVNAIVLPAHAQTSCSGFTNTTVNESLSLIVSAASVSGPIDVTRTGLTFSGSEQSTLGGCVDNQSLVVNVEFSGTIDPANNQITGDINILQTCGGRFVGEQTSQFTVDQQPASASDTGTYQGTLTGTLRSCDDF